MWRRPASGGMSFASFLRVWAVDANKAATKALSISSTENDMKVHPSITEERVSDPTTSREQLSRADGTRRHAPVAPAISQLSPSCFDPTTRRLLRRSRSAHVFWPDWIEALTGYDPDQYDGTVEGSAARLEGRQRSLHGRRALRRR